MRFTPEEIEVKEFVTRFRGYDREEVHAFLRLLADDVRTLGVEPQLSPNGELQPGSLINAHSMALKMLLEMAQLSFESWDNGTDEVGRIRTQARVAGQALETWSSSPVRLPGTVQPKSIAAPDGFPPIGTANGSHRAKSTANADNARNPAGLVQPQGTEQPRSQSLAGEVATQPAASSRRLTRGLGVASLAIPGVVAVLTLIMALFRVSPSAESGPRVLVSVLTLSGLLTALACISCLALIKSRTHSRVQSGSPSHRRPTQSEDDHTASLALPGRADPEPSGSRKT